MNEKVILLVEDNPDDELLTLRALQKNNITNKVVVARDGQQAIDYVFGVRSSSGHPTEPLPQVILLDLKLPNLDGFEVLRRLRADDRTRLLPVVILTTSNEEQDRFGRPITSSIIGLGRCSWLRGLLAHSLCRGPFDDLMI